MACWLIQVGQEFRYAGRVLPWWRRCGHRLALARLRRQPVLLRGLGELERPSEQLRCRFLQVERGQLTCCSWKAPVLRCRSTSSKPVKLPTVTMFKLTLSAPMRASGDGLDAAATFPEGQQLVAERAAFEAAKRLYPKDLIEYRKGPSSWIGAARGRASRSLSIKLFLISAWT